MKERLVWAVSAKHYWTPMGYRHLVLKSQVNTCESALCEYNPDIYKWTVLESRRRMAKYPKCRACLRLSAKRKAAQP